MPPTTATPAPSAEGIASLRQMQAEETGRAARYFVGVVDGVGCVCLVLSLFFPILAAVGVLLWIFGLLYLIERHLRAIASRR